MSLAPLAPLRGSLYYTNALVCFYCSGMTVWVKNWTWQRRVRKNETGTGHRNERCRVPDVFLCPRRVRCSSSRTEPWDGAVYPHIGQGGGKSDFDSANPINRDSVDRSTLVAGLSSSSAKRFQSNDLSRTSSVTYRSPALRSSFAGTTDRQSVVNTDPAAHRTRVRQSDHRTGRSDRRR